jgi:ABC-type phosphate transport system ATPase subunit
MVDILEQVEIGRQWGLEEDLWSNNWNQLSGGEIQRVTLAIAVSREPDLLLLDGMLHVTLIPFLPHAPTKHNGQKLEPTSALDPDTTLLVERTLKTLNCLWITHSPEQEKRVSTARLELRKELHTTHDQEGMVRLVFSNI